MHIGQIIGHIARSRIFWGLTAPSLWVAAYWIYLKKDFSRFLERRSAQRWGVDLASRRITAGRKPLV